MSQPARKLEPVPFPPAPTEAELQAAIERSLYPDGTVCPEALAVELAVEMPPDVSSTDPQFRFRRHRHA